MAIGGQEPRRSAEVESALMWQEPEQKESACQELARQEIAQQAPVRGPSAQAMRRRTARSGTRGRAGDHANTRRFFWMFASFDQFAFPNSHLPFRRRRPRPPQASCCHPSVIAKRRLVLLWNNEKLPPFQYVVPYCACAISSSVLIAPYVRPAADRRQRAICPYVLALAHALAIAHVVERACAVIPSLDWSLLRLPPRCPACSDLFAYADEIAAARTVLRREHADPGTASDLVDRVEQVDDVEAYSEGLSVGHGEFV